MKAMNHEHFHHFLELAHRHEEHVIGTIATILILGAAFTTLEGHVAHTHEVMSQALAVDQWGFYQAKHIRAHMYAIEADKALAADQDDKKGLARRYLEKAIYEQCGRPAAESCEVNEVPVLKDSPVLQTFYRTPHSRSTDIAPGNKRRAGPSPIPPNAQNVNETPIKAVRQPKHVNGAIDLIGVSRDKEKDVAQYQEMAEFFDKAEIDLEVAIMFCSLGIVIGTRTYWRFAYLITFIGVCAAVPGVVAGLRGWSLHLAFLASHH
jgi:Domain of unknown function (DUF4337)